MTMTQKMRTGWNPVGQGQIVEKNVIKILQGEIAHTNHTPNGRLMKKNPTSIWTGLEILKLKFYNCYY
jgi:hypothetical protein